MEIQTKERNILILRQHQGVLKRQAMENLRLGGGSVLRMSTAAAVSAMSAQVVVRTLATPATPMACPSAFASNNRL